MNDLISRSAAIAALRAASARPSSISEIEALPSITPQVVANMSGGVLQGASSDHRVDLYALDFDVDSFDEDSCGILVEGSMAYLGQVSAHIDPAFVKEVAEAEEINFATGEPVDA